MHSVFERAVNVQDGAALYALTTAVPGDGPLRLVTDAPSYNGFALQPGARVAVTDSTLCVGRLVVDLSQVRRWHPMLPSWVARPNLIRDLIRIIDSEGRAGDDQFHRSTPQGEARGASGLDEITQALESALGAGDLGAAYGYGSRLVGLGSGLTPTGDDYLLGMLAAFAMPGDDSWHAHEQVIRRVVRDNSQRTNDISRAALLQASRGRVCESIIDLERTLVGDDRSALPASARRVLAIGHSSGTDIATGLLAGLRLRASKAPAG